MSGLPSCQKKTVLPVAKGPTASASAGSAISIPLAVKTSVPPTVGDVPAGCPIRPEPFNRRLRTEVSAWRRRFSRASKLQPSDFALS